jgi:hypothetical protein
VSSHRMVLIYEAHTVHVDGNNLSVGDLGRYRG